MKQQLQKAHHYQLSVYMIYIDNEGIITKRKIDVMSVDRLGFTAYCYLRKTKRRFLYENVLALEILQQEGRMMTH